MSSFYRRYYVRKAKRPGVRTPPRSNKLEGIERSLSASADGNVLDALGRLRTVTTSAKVEQLYRSGNADKIAGLFKPGATRDFFDNVGDTLAEAMSRSGAVAVQGLPIGRANQATLSLRNDRIDAYVSTRTGALIKGVPDDMQVIVQNAVRTGLASGKSPSDIAKDIYDGVGLDPTRANAVATYAGKDREAFRESMTQARAEMIARTEVSFAINHGQVEAWKQAEDDGFIDDGAKKVWITDPDPCPKICEMMDGVEVGLNETFILPDGVEVVAPPAHPRCKCFCGILEVDGKKPSSGRERQDADDIGSDSTEEDDGSDADE